MERLSLRAGLASITAAPQSLSSSSASAPTHTCQLPACRRTSFLGRQEPQLGRSTLRATTGRGTGTGSLSSRGRRIGQQQRGAHHRVCAASSSSGPLSPESPSGQLLRELIEKHPHLVPSAADQQLDLLAQQGEGGEEGEKKSGSDLVLYKRIEQVRRQERQRAVEEVIYSLVVQRFIDAGSPLLPTVPFVPLDPSSPLTLSLMGLVPSAPSKAPQLQAVHSEEALSMVQEHLERVLGGKSGGIPGGSAMEDRVLVGTSRLRLGQVYAASIMYGYFLKRVDQRFQLEKGMRMMLGAGLGLGAAALGGAAGSEKGSEKERLEEEKRARMAEFTVEGEGGEKGGEDSVSDLLGLGLGQGKGKGEEKPVSALRAYVSSFDAPALQSAVTVRSREGISVVERHTEALFGKPEVVGQENGVAVLKDDQTHITVSTLRRLILEAVAFGNFLWDVESYVDSRCKITS